MTLQTKLDEIRERLEKATPGPWHHEPERYSAKNVIGIKPRDDRWLGHCQPEMNGYANAELIANAPTDIAFLLSTIQKLQELNRVYEEALNFYDQTHRLNWCINLNDPPKIAQQALAQKSKILGEGEE